MTPPPAGKRGPGRRPGESGTRQAILDAARAQFAAHGWDGATIRAIAADAGVDPAQCMSMQNAQPLICEARTVTSLCTPWSSSTASSSRSIAAKGLGASSSIAMRRARTVALMIASCRL